MDAIGVKALSCLSWMQHIPQQMVRMNISNETDGRSLAVLGCLSVWSRIHHMSRCEPGARAGTCFETWRASEWKSQSLPKKIMQSNNERLISTEVTTA